MVIDRRTVAEQSSPKSKFVYSGFRPPPSKRKILKLFVFKTHIER